MKLLAFDMDGTIFDNTPVLVESYTRTVALFNAQTGLSVAIASPAEILQVIGQPPLGLFRGLMPGVDDKYCDLMVKLFNQQLIIDIKKGGGRVYPGIIELIKRLHAEGFTLLMASNGAANYLETILDAHQIREYFYSQIVVVDGKHIHNKDQLVNYYLDHITHQGAVMIGDRTSDLNAAITNKIPFIGCAYGHAVSEIETQPYIAHEVQQLYAMIKKITDEF